MTTFISIVFLLLLGAIALYSGIEGFNSYVNAESSIHQIYAVLHLLIFTFSIGFISLLIELNSIRNSIRHTINKHHKELSNKPKTREMEEKAIFKEPKEWIV